MAGGGEIIVIKKKKAAGHGGAHGGAWKVAYADFVTAMMAFFLVMWLMGADEETKQAVSHYFNHPNTPYKQGGDPQSNAAHPMGESEGHGDNVLAGASGLFPEDLIDRPIPHRDLMKENVTISKMIEDLLEGNVFGMDVTENQIKFSLPEHVLFDAGSATLHPNVDKYMALLGNVLKSFKGYVRIEGHSDDTPTNGTRFANNYELSMARAVSVMQYLVKNHGMGEDRVIPTGAGAREPLVPNTSVENRAKNRRVELTLMYEYPSN
ncbi:MAG TPA: flagellar motor protein MotB [Oligoflexia bacterium]|nr:flagellar motor protein MotB [Oligoflexia bacterium]